jgi:glycosyltransferase involved in cell wall biosynthesis
MAGPNGVLHLGKYYPPHMGGMEVYLQQLVSGQSKVMDVAVIVANDLRRTQIEVVDGVKISRVLSLGVLASMPITPTMAWHIRQDTADLVHLHMPNPGAALSLLATRHKGELVITHHADTLGRKQLRRLSDPLVRRVMERCGAIIVTSKRYLDSSDELAPFHDKCHIIPLGIDPTRFEGDGIGARQGIRAKYGDRLILAVGRLVPYKGFEYLIRSMVNVNGTLLLVGEGPLRESLLNCIRKYGVQDKVVLLGHVDDIAQYYKAASIFVIPSITRAEAFGVVQMEAMASGIPVINTDIPSGVPEVSVHGKTGLTVPPKDPETLANAITLLLDNPALRLQFGEAARERVRDKFSVGKMVAQTMNVYHSVMSSSI